VEVSGVRVAPEPVVALAFGLFEAPGEAAPCDESIPISLHAPSAAAAVSAIVAVVI
jgi:hypothetical protein